MSDFDSKEADGSDSGGPEIGGANAALPQLIDLTYSATTDPSRYDDLVLVWERYMEQLDPGEVEDAQKRHLRHFNQALEIFEKIGRSKSQKDQEEVVTNLFTAPAYIVDRDLNILHVNDAAQSDRFHAGRLEDRLDNDLMQAALRDIEGGAPAGLIPLHDPAGQLIDCAVISEIQGQHGAAQRYLLVLDGDRGAVAHLPVLAEKFSLSAAESEVLEALLRGQTAAEISENRGVGLATTRTQVRQLLEKTGSANLSDMIRRMGQITAQLASVEIARKAGRRGQEDRVDYDRILTSDGRLLAYRDFGDPRGRPVLFIHNMMGGAIWPERMERLARARNWRIIAPSRPGFGLSDSFPARDMDLVRQTCLDMRALLDYLMIDRVLVVGMMSSAGLGIRFAKDHGDRSVALLNIGHGGLMDDQMIAAMDNPARAMAKTYRKSPTALRFLIRVAVASVDLLGPQQMLRSNFQSSGPDARLLAETDVVDAIGAGLQHAIAQGGEAFSRDGFVALHDFGPDIAGVACPALCLLGRQDRMYPMDQAERLVAPWPNYQLELFDEAGQFVFYSHPEASFDLMDRLWRQGTAEFLK